MISKSQIKHIRSLQLHKFRQIHYQYIVEGEKMLNELLNSGQKILQLFALPEWIELNKNLLLEKNIIPEIINQKELEGISVLTTPNKVLAVVAVKEEVISSFSINEGLYIGLENLQDPGNMGTIIRSAEWFGVKAIFCTENTVDIYNPKVVQASMGSIFRMPVIYLNLNNLLKENAEAISYAAVLGGKNVYETTFPKNAILLIGNESKGLSAEIAKQCKHQITIPSFGKAESLNAAVASSILLALMKK